MKKIEIKQDDMGHRILFILFYEESNTLLLNYFFLVL